MAEESLVPSPHDRFFKETFSRLETAASFFQEHLPAPLASALDWSSLRLEPGSFVDEQLGEQCSDLLYTVCGPEVLLGLYCLFEHQSTVDPDMPFRLLRYMVRIWEQWRKRSMAPGRCPPIVSVVLHQGPERWTVSTQFLDWLAIPESLRDVLDPLQPSFRHLLVDLSQWPMDRISGEVLGRLALTLMKAVREGSWIEWLEGSTAVLAELLGQGDRAGVIRTMLRYLFQGDLAGGASTIVDLVGKVRESKLRETVMTLEERIKQIGRQEGRQEGLERGTMIGRVQQCQEMLDLPVSGVSELAWREPMELEQLLRDLEAKVRCRLGSGPH